MTKPELKFHFLVKMWQHEQRGGQFTVHTFGVSGGNPETRKPAAECVVCAVGACLVNEPEMLKALWETMQDHEALLANTLQIDVQDVLAVEAGYSGWGNEFYDPELVAFGEHLRELFPPDIND